MNYVLFQTLLFFMLKEASYILLFSQNLFQILIPLLGSSFTEVEFKLSEELAHIQILLFLVLSHCIVTRKTTRIHRYRIKSILNF